MKTKPHPFIPAVLAAVLGAPAFALEAPADDAPPPPTVENKIGQPEPPADEPPAAKAKAFLGVVSGEIPAILADHLNLKPGEGIIVRALVPDGPAAKSGITVNDVITKVADKPVGSPLALSNQIAAHPPGATVAIELIHQGKPTKLDATLGSKPAEIAAMDPRPLDPLDLEGLPQELADRVRKAIEGNLGELDLQPGEDALHDLKKRMADAMEQGLKPPNAAGQLQIRGGATLKMQDPQGSIEVTSKGGAKEVTIRDKQDRVTWSGPWDTEQDKAAAPADVRQRIDSLHLDLDFKGDGLRLRMNPAAPPDAIDD